VSTVRRLILWVLFFAVPMQAAMGATGLLCVKAAHHASSVQLHAHAEGTGDHSLHSGAFPVHSHDPQPVPDSAETEQASLELLGAGKCSACGTCCFSAVAIPPTHSSFFQVDAGLTVSLHVGPAIATRAGDGLFRPPRTLTL